MRAYTVATAALALDTPVKWLDNVLSHHSVAGVPQGRQGLQRRLPLDAIVILSVARAIHREVGAPIGRSLELAHEACARPAGDGEAKPAASTGSQIRLTVDVGAVRQAVDARLREAVEFGAAPRRGRPPTREA